MKLVAAMALLTLALSARAADPPAVSLPALSRVEVSNPPPFLFGPNVRSVTETETGYRVTLKNGRTVNWYRTGESYARSDGARGFTFFRETPSSALTVHRDSAGITVSSNGVARRYYGSSNYWQRLP